MVEGKDIRGNEMLEKHADWVDEFTKRHDDINKNNVLDILKREVGVVFGKVLEDAGVYKCTEEGRMAFMRFIDSVS